MIALISTLDTGIEQALFAARTPLGVRAFELITELGSGAFIVAALLIACFLLWKKGLFGYAIGIVVSLAGALAMSEIMKRLLERARPPQEWRAIIETGYSFPSNHATASAALYGFLAYLAWKLAPGKWRAILITLCALVILLVGFSRMYLGVHYLSDVLGGYLVGAFFAWLGTRAAEKFK